MGGKRTRAGEFFLLCTAGLILLMVSGCAGARKESSFVIVKGEPPRSKPVCVEEAVPPPPAKPPEPPAPVQKPEPADAAARPEPVPEPQKAEAENPLLSRARKSFEKGDYNGSQKENLKILSLSSKSAPKDQALFNLGLIYACVENPQRDLSRALFYFRKLLKDYPQSPLGGEAKTWAGVLEESEKLAYIIEELKKVDRNVDEKKREKAR
ncbi:MAG TPA: hypothetical protein VLS90_06595 [Thermodesulfobacteriota bacterium]|nr:hypothetical protein [Thermodesulfobacteriota bacterium]